MNDKKVKTSDPSKILNRPKMDSTRTKINPNSTCMPENDLLQEELSLVGHAKKNRTPLKLDEPSVKPKTRQELYRELSKDEKVMTDEDHFDFPTPLERGVSQVIDIFFMFVLIKLLAFLVPYEVKIIDYFLDGYHIQFMFGQEAMVKTVFISQVVLAVYFTILVPGAFFHSSLGKKITKIRVRGENKYTLSLTQVFMREIIWKPLGMALLIGFILPFFDKKKRSLHDRFSGTIVVKG